MKIGEHEMKHLITLAVGAALALQLTAAPISQ
jgi:hypothetical protein